MSFRLKTILGIAAIEALLLTILIVSGLHYLTVSNQDQLLQRGQSTAKLVATMTADAVIAVDLATLDALIEQSLQNEDIVYLRIRNQSGQVLSQGGDDNALGQAFREDNTIDAAQSDQRLDVSAPVQIAGTNFGQIELGLSTAKLETTIAAAFKWMASIALSEMVLVALAGWILGTYLTRQLRSLKAGAKQVATGDFGHQISVRGKDELADTAISFNQMSQSLRRYADLAEEARLKAESGREFAENTLRDALDSMQDGVVIFDKNEDIVLMNKSYEACYNLTDKVTNGSIKSARTLFFAQSSFHKKDQANFLQSALDKLHNPDRHRRWEHNLKDGRHLLIAQQTMSNGGIVLVQTDVTQLYETLEENRQLQMELMQRHKTEALGTMAGGMAHEINTPVQFMSDNIAFVASGVSDLCCMINELRDRSKKSGSLTEVHLSQAMETADWDFLHEELPQAVNEMQTGIQRIRDQIVTFKQFASADSGEKELVNLKEAIQTSLKISQMDLKSDIKIDVNAPSDDRLASISCNRTQINQVIHSLVSNAFHAIEDTHRSDGKIDIELKNHGESISIAIRDNGCGISEDQLPKIFDTLYTTKEPGRGTGHGLALCQRIVERDHGGVFDVSSKPDQGSCFTFSLPFKRTHKAA